jgi:hypothetical protein
MSNQLATQQNQELTDSQLVLSKKISQVGKLSEVAFVKKVIEFKQIRSFNLSNDLDRKELSKGVSMLLVKASVLSGLKNEISNINKDDIMTMIVKYNKSLSLEELDYAFQLERYNLLPPKSNHFQLFNAEYVSEILNKYKTLRADIRFNNDLPMTLIDPKDESNELSQEDKDLIVITGVISAYEYFLENKKIESGKPYVYEYLYELNAFPKHDNAYRIKIKALAKDEMLENLKQQKIKSKNLKEVKSIKSVIDKVTKDEHPLRSKCQEITLRNFYDEVIESGKTYSNVLSGLKNIDK